MKKVEKEIKVTRYVAFDGTEFETEAECANYEGSAFGKLMTELPVISVHTSNKRLFEEDKFVEKGFTKCYALVPRTRHDIFTLNQVLSMGGSDDTAKSEDCYNLVVLQVSLCCNMVVAAKLQRPYEWVKEISNGQFEVISNIKDNVRK